MVIRKACQLLTHSLLPPRIAAVSPQDTLGGYLSIIDFKSSFNLLPCVSVSRLSGGSQPFTRHYLYIYTTYKRTFRANEGDCIELMLKAFSSDEIPRSLLLGKLECMSCNWMTCIILLI